MCGMIKSNETERKSRAEMGANMHIVLHQPEIPANTGNIGRTCVATGSALHLIEPLGFRLNEKEIKRAGMDYWEHLDVRRYINFGEFLEKNPGAKIWMATTKATCIRIPMLDKIRSLNLSNSVAIVLYEALRQNGFGSLQREGELHRLHWK